MIFLPLNGQSFLRYGVSLSFFWYVDRVQKNFGHDFAERTRRKDFVRAKLKNGEYNVTGDITDDIISNPLEPNREEHWSSPILAF